MYSLMPITEFYAYIFFPVNKIHILHFPCIARSFDASSLFSLTSASIQGHSFVSICSGREASISAAARGRRTARAKHLAEQRYGFSRRAVAQ